MKLRILVSSIVLGLVFTGLQATQAPYLTYKKFLNKQKQSVMQAKNLYQYYKNRLHSLYPTTETMPGVIIVNHSSFSRYSQQHQALLYEQLQYWKSVYKNR
jgi:hypothetical protein